MDQNGVPIYFLIPLNPTAILPSTQAKQLNYHLQDQSIELQKRILLNFQIEHIKNDVPSEKPVKSIKILDSASNLEFANLIVL